MALLQPSLDYTDRDFDALRARLHNLIDSAYPEWTDRSKADFGNILIECFSFVGDVLGFYLDNQAKESRITTAQLRRSLLALSKLVKYVPIGAVAATADLTFTLAAPPVGTVTILAGDRFRTANVSGAVSFQALAATVIAAGANPAGVTFTVEHSENSTEAFQSSALPNQELRLSDTPFLDGSLSVSAADGAYTVVEDFLQSTAVDRHVTVAVDENDVATLRFGNGLAGAIPQGVITCNYKVGGGTVGNVDAGTIIRAEKSYTDSFGNPVQVTVTNPEKASGGDNRQTVEAIRVAAPRSTRALTRSVGLEDFEIHALKVPGVARALMLTRNQDPAIDENQGRLIIVPNGGGAPSQALLDAVLTQVTVTFPHTVTFLVEVFAATFKTINVQATVFPTFGTVGTAAQRAALAASIRTALTAFFALDAADGSPNELIDFGYKLDNLMAFSDLYNVVRDVTGVRRIGDQPSDFLLNGVPGDVELAAHEFPQLGTVTLINGFTGAPL